MVNSRSCTYISTDHGLFCFQHLSLLIPKQSNYQRQKIVTGTQQALEKDVFSGFDCFLGEKDAVLIKNDKSHINEYV